VSAANVLVLKVVPYLTLGVHGGGGHAELAGTSVHASRLLLPAAIIIILEFVKISKECHSKVKQIGIG